MHSAGAPGGERERRNVIDGARALNVRYQVAMDYVGEKLALEQPHDYRFPAAFPPGVRHAPGVPADGP